MFENSITRVFTWVLMWSGNITTSVLLALARRCCLLGFFSASITLSSFFIALVIAAIWFLVFAMPGVTGLLCAAAGITFTWC